MSVYGQVKEPRWEGDVWIVAGGPSARRIDLRFLKGKKHVLAVNDAIDLVVPEVFDAPAIFSLDPGWVLRRRDFLSVYPGEKYVSLSLFTWPECLGIPGLTYLRRSTDIGLSDDPGIIRAGCNSGYGAINLAYLKGARRIVLIGYDMDPFEDEKFTYWAPMFRSMLPQLKQRNVEVLNANLESHIDAFPRVRLEDIT